MVGRRSGKTRIAAATAVYIGATEKHHLAPGEVGYDLLLAASRSQASGAYQYVVGYIESSPILRGQIQSVTAEEVRLKGNIIIGVHAGSYRFDPVGSAGAIQFRVIAWPKAIVNASFRAPVRGSTASHRGCRSAL